MVVASNVHPALPVFDRYRSSPNISKLGTRAGRMPSWIINATPSSSRSTRGSRLRNLSSIRSWNRLGGGVRWESHETMKYFLGLSGRAEWSQPSGAGVSRRQVFSGLTWMSASWLTTLLRGVQGSGSGGLRRVQRWCNAPSHRNQLRQ